MRRAKMKSRKRIFAAVMCAAALGAGMYAFTASNTVPESMAGDGSGIVSGYTVSNVQYNQDALNPENLASYQFTLDAAANDVTAKVVASQTAYDTCTSADDIDWSCTPPADTTIESIDELRVIATQ